ncbi:hypothetical protein HF086_014643 [Spodoptera exigua]|uniref:Uncharacterized protein n=1 Tax=Spodoptera exigua TaxID=7107 RepID=A0A922SAT6_SPOEX|nr:hypothetical protein HF086_014643 [Spodoptera exigua]
MGGGGGQSLRGLLLLGGLQHAAGMASVTAPAVPRELIVADGFTPITAASACWPAKPASLSHGDVRYNHLLLSSRAAPPLRAFAILKNTLGVGQKRDHVKSVSQQFISVTNFCSTLKTLCQKTMY